MPVRGGKARGGAPRRDVRQAPSLPPLVDEWAEELETQNRSPKTIAGYLIDLRQYHEWLRDRDPLTVTGHDIRRYARVMTKAGLGPAARARRTVAIRAWYRHLVETGRLPQSPAELIKPPKQDKRQARWLEPAEVQQLRRVIPRTDRGLRDRALIELGLGSLRISEPLGLDLEDVDLTRREVRIMGKGREEATQPITKLAAQALRAWLERRPPCRSQAVFIPLPPRGEDCRLHYTTLEKSFHRYLKDAGITKRVRFHDLRHTLGVHLARRGVPLQFIQDLLRHKSPATTRIYTDVAKEQLAEVLDREGGFTE